MLVSRLVLSWRPRVRGCEEQLQEVAASVTQVLVRASPAHSKAGPWAGPCPVAPHPRGSSHPELSVTQPAACEGPSTGALQRDHTKPCAASALPSRDRRLWGDLTGGLLATLRTEILGVQLEADS